MKTRAARPTLVARLRDARRLRLALSAAGFALATALGAQIAIPLPGTPVPVTLQTVPVLLAGITLGPLWGTGSMLGYLLLGSVGYHVFALGRGDAHVLLGPTAGYLIGFVLAQPLLGLLAAKVPTRRWRGRLAMAVVVSAGNAVIFATGLIGLMLALGCNLPQAVMLGVVPFVPGMLLKTLIVTELGVRLHRRPGPDPDDPQGPDATGD